ncbi:MAG: CBS domain-containing protein, partial [Nitrososphaera sp.]
MVKRSVREHTDPHMTTRVLVRDIMNSPVISASPSETLRDLARKMKEEKIGSIVIMENGKPIGMVTDWDIVSAGVVRDV